ncbi:MAG: M23 family metallopeptidase [Caldicoprobacter sp.]|jgi:Membrane proteins related to metalloendopeptidases|uniref:peptidoglycan DD-metalloendopeptidase family protein n=1 Tax=Caldicoprobacter sp. TaxID=2004500 RepID=UPI001D563C1B|nr:hypothetical protein [Clostridia bacterium]
MGFAKYKEKIRNAFNKQAFKDFWNRLGFYIILFICVCAIGATAFWTSMDRDKMQGEAQGDMAEQDIQDELVEEPVQQADASDKVNIRIIDVAEDKTQGEREEETSQSQPDKVDHGDDKSKTAGDKLIPVNAVNSKPKVVNTGATAQAQKTSKVLLQKPVNGRIVVDFALDHLQYSRTLKEWTTHPGIDIESPVGTPVRAALDGVVESIEEDSLMGIIITIDHGNGLKTRYANLSTKDMVRLNQQVKKGQVISGVGRTAISEILDAPHLHFEVLKDGENVDPKNYLE